MLNLVKKKTNQTQLLCAKGLNTVSRLSVNMEALLIGT